jgi:hypothetical protein
VSAEIGRMPRVLVLDSATGFGRRVTMTRVSYVCQAHYRIGEVRFWNAAGCLARQRDYCRDDTIPGLFERDVADMLTLPGVSFDPVRWEIGHADNPGIVMVDGARHLTGRNTTTCPCTWGCAPSTRGIDPLDRRHMYRPARAGLRRERRDG